MASAFLVGQLKTQMVKLIESFEPQLEQGLRTSLISIRQSNPKEAKLFLEKWQLLDLAVAESLSKPLPGGKRSAKRTKRHSRK